MARLLDGEKMRVLCEELGISRRSGYKIVERYQASGVHGLTDRSRRPYGHANQLPLAVENDRPPEEGTLLLGGAEALEAAARALAGAAPADDPAA